MRRWRRNRKGPANPLISVRRTKRRKRSNPSYTARRETPRIDGGSALSLLFFTIRTT